jgi:hypothetical protein
MLIRGLGLLIVGVLMYKGASEQEAVLILTSVLGLLGLGGWTAHHEIKAQKKIKMLQKEISNEEEG